jgi:hypothetical protein
MKRKERKNLFKAKRKNIDSNTIAFKKDRKKKSKSQEISNLAAKII